MFYIILTVILAVIVFAGACCAVASKHSEFSEDELKILLELAAEGACIEQMKTLDKAKQIEQLLAEFELL